MSLPAFAASASTVSITASGGNYVTTFTEDGAPGNKELFGEHIHPSSNGHQQMAERILAAAEEAERQGRGVVAVDGKMVDAPIIARARHLISLAGLYGMEGGGEQ